MCCLVHALSSSPHAYQSHINRQTDCFLISLACNFFNDGIPARLHRIKHNSSSATQRWVSTPTAVMVTWEFRLSLNLLSLVHRPKWISPASVTCVNTHTRRADMPVTYRQLNSQRLWRSHAASSGFQRKSFKSKHNLQLYSSSVFLRMSAEPIIKSFEEHLSTLRKNPMMKIIHERQATCIPQSALLSPSLADFCGGKLPRSPTHYPSGF